MTAPATLALDVRNLRISFKGERGRIDVVRGVDFCVRRGETLAIVGESGSGKSLTALALMGLLPHAAKVSGSVEISGQRVSSLRENQWGDVRGKRVAMIFQNPMSSLNPVL